MSASPTTDSITPDSKVWLITGCSRGFGRVLAIAACDRGHVIAAAKEIDSIRDLKQLGCETLQLDATASDDTVEQVIAAAQAIHGRIDILVNTISSASNATDEEKSHPEMLRSLEPDVLGLAKVTAAVALHMRAQRSGTIATIGSSCDYEKLPAWQKTKLAVTVIAHALCDDTVPVGIEMATIEPDSFRTSSIRISRRLEDTLAEYKPIVASMAARTAELTQGEGSEMSSRLMVDALSGFSNRIVILLLQC